jgi:hypothetical protein
MILGLPWTSWVLLLVGVGSGLGISLAFYLSHRGELLKEEAEGDPVKGEGGVAGAGGVPEEAEWGAAMADDDGAG